MKKKLCSMITVALLSTVLQACQVDNQDKPIAGRGEVVLKTTDIANNEPEEMKYMKSQFFGGEGKEVDSDNDELVIRNLMREMVEKPQIDIHDPDVQEFSRYVFSNTEHAYVDNAFLQQVASNNVNLSPSQARGVKKILHTSPYKDFYIENNAEEAKAYLAHILLSEAITGETTLLNKKKFTEEEIEQTPIIFDGERALVEAGSYYYGDNSVRFVKKGNTWFVDYTENMQYVKQKVNFIEDEDKPIMQPIRMYNRTTSVEEPIRMYNRTTSVEEPNL